MIVYLLYSIDFTYFLYFLYLSLYAWFIVDHKISNISAGNQCLYGTNQNHADQIYPGYLIKAVLNFVPQHRLPR